MDIQTGKIVPVGSALEGNANMPLYEKQAEDLVFAKIQHPSEINIEKLFEIRYDDIDVNKHANNCNYVIWAFEL